MDLETYIARYSGETRLQRLLLVAQQCPDEAVATQAFGMAEAQMKQDGNLRQYKKVFGLSTVSVTSGETSGDMAMQFLGESKSSEGNLRRPPPSSFQPDESWMTSTESANKEARHVLQGRLSASQSQMHREAIRNAYVALAKHDAKTGNASAALASLFRAMDYCTSRTQSGQLSLVLLEVALNAGCYVQAREYVTKLEHTLQGNPAGATSSEGTEILQDVSIKLKIASGLERMAQGDYATAALTFSKLCKAYGGATSKLDWPTVASADDIALYASLLSLATQGRGEILELAEHPEALELVPAMKELLLLWAKANYVKSIQAFSQEGTIMDFPDLYLSTGDKWEKLCQSIREKCLLEYLKPYQCVQLEHMSKLFPSIANIQDTLVDLMGRGLLEGAKIDGRANVLRKTQVATYNPAQPTLKDLGQMEDRILDDAHAMLIRLACLEQDLCVSDGLSSVGSRRRAAAYGRDHMVEDDDDSSDEDTPMMDADMQAAAAQNPEDLY
mmetsp:Transcript_8264/g.19923  ORF Transcript_8264/g.19923 Transcript_8264/m.19923 type:complete len:501 (+) Transcript_8264:274-1776(+)